MPTARVQPSAVSVAEINVTPMIDVLLVLLVIFMVMRQTRMAIPVQVPAAERSAGPVAVQIVLELTADGGYAVNGQPIPAAELPGQLAAIFADRPAKLLFVRASPVRRYREVVTAMDLARGVGVQVVALMPTEATAR